MCVRAFFSAWQSEINREVRKTFGLRILYRNKRRMMWMEATDDDDDADDDEQEQTQHRQNLGK